MNKLINSIIFSLCGVSGFFIGYFLSKKKYEIILKNEIESVKETYAAAVSTNKDFIAIDTLDKKELNKSLSSDDDIDEKTANFLVEDDLTNLSEEKSSDLLVGIDVANESETPYVIESSDFNEIYGYESCTLTYYSDGILADEDFEIIEDIENIVGDCNLNIMDEKSIDCLYVRNDSKCCDYEILRTSETYEDAFNDFKEYEEKYE